MRYFHDYMTTSWPHLPLEREEAWLNEIPILAQQHEFLMHAILALGASHLHARTNLDLQKSVESHRSIAMRGLNSIASEENLETAKDAGPRLTALLATSYLLSFSASYMGDSLSLFLVLVRACASITGQIVQANHLSPLLPWNARSLTADSHLEVMRRRLERAEQLPAGDVEEALQSLQRVEAECEFVPFQRKLFDNMKAALVNVDKPFEAYTHFVAIWTLFTTLSSDDFATFTSPTNDTSTVLQAHFLALESLMRPWLVEQFVGRNEDGRRNGLHALPSSATLEDRGLPIRLVEWPIKRLKADAETNHIAK
jgi:hypothetical protein